MSIFKYVKNPKYVLALELLIVLPFILINLLMPRGAFLGIKIEASPSPAAPSPSPSPIPTPTPSPSPSPSASPVITLSKSTYIIAAYGDSMVDTMGENLEYLDAALRIKYPNNHFKFYNYGIGGQNVQDGLSRFGSSFSYQTRSYPPISQISADVIIVGSFAYNPFPNHDKNRHYDLLTQLVNQAKGTGSQVYMLAEIAPKKTGFGVGPGGVNWPPELTGPHVEHIIEQLQNAISISQSANVGLINVYAKSTIDGKYGNPIYVNAHDGIHPSVEGHSFTANVIANTLKLK